MVQVFNPLNHPICLTEPERLTPFSAWHEHIPVAMFLVDILKPSVLVELGTQYGDSYCAFCQAVKKLNLDTRCYAIDTWQGDTQTGFYDPEVLEELKRYHHRLYGSFSRLIQSTFDDALPHFADATIDLLHIDGYHTYEAVKHDFETWLPKLSPCGVVLFHDTNVRESDFGVWQFWREMRRRYAGFEFFHGYGLGILAVGDVRVEALQELLQAVGEDAIRIRDYFFQLGYRFTVKSEAAAKDQILQGRTAQLAQLRDAVGDKDRQLAQLHEVLKEHETQLTQLQDAVSDKDGQLVQLHEVLKEHETQLAQLQDAVGNKDGQLAQLQDAVGNKDGQLAQFHEAVRQKDTYITRLENVTREWEETLRRIYGSHGWKVLTVGYRLRDVMLPIESRRRKAAKFAWQTIWNCPTLLTRENIKKSLSYIRYFGFKAYINKAKEYHNKHTRERIVRIDNVSQIQHQENYKEYVSVLENNLKIKLNLFLSDPLERLIFPRFEEPMVSILIPTYNKGEYLYDCLESILAYTKEVSYEVIIVDDCSSDATTQLLQKLENVKVVRNEKNLEFLRSCNRGISLVEGYYTLFLNNDIRVTPQWLAVLVSTIEQYPQCGAVGGKLIRLDGSLQEAGSIIWQDGSGLGYGRDDVPGKPEYGYLREVDYCSAACLLVRTEILQQLGGFDERYIPAYYEDSDLCFAIRERGYTVVFQPHASVLHYEFGSRSLARAIALMQANQPKFVHKWQDVLVRQAVPGDVLRARDRRQGKRVLVMDDQIPAPYLGSGFPRAYTLLQFLHELGYTVTFMPLHNCLPHHPHTHLLQQSGIEVFYGDDLHPETLLHSRAGYYDIVIVSRPHNGKRFLPLVRQEFANARIVYDAEALFCVREFRKAEVEGRGLSETEKQEMLREELEVMHHADVITTVSETEREMVVKARTDDLPKVVVWGHAHEIREPVTPFAERKDLLFVGGFTAGNLPNTDTVRHFVSQLFPKIRQRLPACRFIIVGSQPPQRIQELASPHVLVTGFVEDLTRYYEQCRLFIVPLRFGAGIPYKLTEAMSHGIPTVISSVAATGLGLHDGQETLIAKNDAEFIEHLIRLYEDEDLWYRVQQKAQHYIREHCSPQAIKQQLLAILGEPTSPPGIPQQQATGDNCASQTAPPDVTWHPSPNLRLHSPEFDRAVQALQPWWFQFSLGGKTFGGTIPRDTDKIALFFAWVEKLGSPVKTILELGSHEGSHSLQLASHADVEKVVGLEGRADNLARARLVKQVFGIQTVDFHHCNLEELVPDDWPTFDAVFCAGLFYHLVRPWELLAKIALLCERYLFLDTHYAVTEAVQQERYAGTWTAEGPDPLSGLSYRSFWLSFKDLMLLLMEHGFLIRFVRDYENFPKGARAFIFAEKVGNRLVGTDWSPAE